MESVERECGALGGLFQAIVNDMKSSYPVWEDFGAKATKLHSQLRTTVLAAVAFLEAFQKVADMATSSRGQQMAWRSLAPIWPTTRPGATQHQDRRLLSGLSSTQTIRHLHRGE
ncbi:protein MTSS 2-like [Hypomesus transpacificus]|uniref:protein MTSS 2-like n=1 Tax=Hypomesus transpacificus TaxID=137520 RepID=UPI001F085775|nr:protein MTSS 2-like [Hypomesus transpacificus]